MSLLLLQYYLFVKKIIMDSLLSYKGETCVHDKIHGAGGGR